MELEQKSYLYVVKYSAVAAKANVEAAKVDASSPLIVASANSHLDVVIYLAAEPNIAYKCAKRLVSHSLETIAPMLIL